MRVPSWLTAVDSRGAAALASCAASADRVSNAAPQAPSTRAAVSGAQRRSRMAFRRSPPSAVLLFHGIGFAVTVDLVLVVLAWSIEASSVGNEMKPVTKSM